MTEPAPSSGPAQAWAHREGLVRMRQLEAGEWGVEAVQARLQIAETFYRFAIGHDEARIDVVTSCFTEHAVFEVSQGHAEPFTTHTGRAAIGEALTHIIGQQNDQRRHLMSNIVVEELSATTAHVLAYGLVSSVDAERLRLAASVIYVADLSHEPDGCWRFTRFFIGMDAYAGDRPATLDTDPRD